MSREEPAILCQCVHWVSHVCVCVRVSARTLRPCVCVSWLECVLLFLFVTDQKKLLQAATEAKAKGHSVHASRRKTGHSRCVLARQCSSSTPNHKTAPLAFIQQTYPLRCRARTFFSLRLHGSLGLRLGVLTPSQGGQPPPFGGCCRGAPNPGHRASRK